jgi:hypothetical protein
MNSRNNYLIILFLLLSAIPVNAEETGVGAWIVIEGLKGFMYAVGDAFNGLGNQTATRNQTETMMVDILSYQVNPYAIPEVQVWVDYVAYGYYIIALVLLILTFGLEVIDPSIFNSIVDARTTQNRFYPVVGYVIIISILGHYGVWLALELNRVACQVIIQYLIIVLPPTADNFLVYFFLSVVTALLIGVFLIRGFLIVVASVVSTFVIIHFFSSEYKIKIWENIISFLKTVFLQPRLLFYFCLGATFINQIPTIFQSIKPFAYLALSYYILKKGYTAVLGDETVRVITKLATRI